MAGATDQLAPRVLLATQAVSQYAHRQKHYVPLNLAPAELYFVRQWFYGNRNRIVDDWAAELQQAAAALAKWMKTGQAAGVFFAWLSNDRLDD
mgnify:CR=1 FL=1